MQTGNALIDVTTWYCKHLDRRLQGDVRRSDFWRDVKGRNLVQAPQPIPYQGSKRRIALEIIAYLPHETSRLVEPFAGSAAVSLAAGLRGVAQSFLLNDINAPLMALWHEIIHSPEQLSSAYAELWHAQQGQEREFYDHVRDLFNRTQRPEHFLYLLARCVKASVRYNSAGHFNQSPDNRRKGVRPESMRRRVLTASNLLKGRTELRARDYEEILAEATSDDVVYMDPPYQGVSSNRDARYIAGLDLHQFVGSLSTLNDRRVPYIVSYDGRCGDKTYGRPLPPSLSLRHIEVEAGVSTQGTLLGRTEATVESLYLSPALVERLEPSQLRRHPHSGTQLKLLELDK